MPNRILRATLRQSQRWNSCSYFAQTFYARLLMLVDDYGRYEAHPQLLANEAFPYGDPTGLPVGSASIADQLTVICTAGLAIVYEFEGKKYVQLLRWKERVRTPSRFPEPTKEQMTVKCLSNDGQMIASPPSPSPSPSPTPTPTPTPNGARVNGEKNMDPKFQVDTRIQNFASKLSKAYNRPDRPVTDYAELSALAEVCRRPDASGELDCILLFKASLPPKDQRYFPQSVSRLLVAWTETLDRARNYHPTETLSDKISKEVFDDVDRTLRNLERPE